MGAMTDIALERRRQIEEEGWTPGHDDAHTAGELLRAALIYALDRSQNAPNYREDGAPAGWPWGADWWKPKDRRTDLVRAGALCLAEMERITRAAAALKAEKKGDGSVNLAHVERHRKAIAAQIDALDALAAG